MEWTEAKAPGAPPRDVVAIEVPDAFCSQFTVDRTERPYLSHGAVYRAGGSILEQSQRAGGHAGDTVVTGDPTFVRVPRDLELLPGRWLYGGNWMGQFGHFITETLTVLWPLLQDDEPFDGVVFHPFIFDSRPQPWQQELLQLLGVADLPVRVLDKPVRVEHLVVPTRPFTTNVFAAREAVTVWQHAGHALDPPAPAELVYLSRSRLIEDPRRLEGDLALERSLSESGFEVVHPETLTVTEQLRLVRRARVLAGVSGSSLHLSAFAAGSTRVLEIGDRRTASSPLPNQRVVDGAYGRLTAFVPLLTGEDGRREASATTEAVAGLVATSTVDPRTARGAPRRGARRAWWPSSWTTGGRA